MKKISFDFNNMYYESIGEDGVAESDLNGMMPLLKKAQEHLEEVINDPENRVNLSLEWTQLPYQNKKSIAEIQAVGDELARSYENVISLGIGGSYLGLKAAQDALCPAYYNDFTSVRGRRPKIYFDGNNLDPDTISILLANLDPKKTFVIVISKSGETTETKVAFTLVEQWLKKGVGTKYGRQIFAITDPESGTLRKKVIEEQKKDPLAFRNLPVMKGVGGRFSEFNIGLLHMAIVGIKIQDVMDGAAGMFEMCRRSDIAKNPAAIYAALHTILYQKKNKKLAIVMPFSERLKSTADWYVQLLAESLGKKYARTIVRSYDGKEEWKSDVTKVVNVGRTPIPARGTNDLHSIQQNNIEGENDKVITFIKVEKFASDIRIGGTGDFLEGNSLTELLSLAEEATEWALAKEGRPSCTIALPRIDAFNWGALLFFFEMAVAYEGELLNVNAFDQPGVEGYKNYLYYKLEKPGLPKDIADLIKDNPLTKNSKFII